MRETGGRSLDSQCMAARGPSISYRAALEIRVRIYTSVSVIRRISSPRGIPWIRPESSNDNERARSIVPRVRSIT
ncbi:hypothetical protein ANTRET_LOCUS8373 [Anthophora retusa]